MALPHILADSGIPQSQSCTWLHFGIRTFSNSSDPTLSQNMLGGSNILNNDELILMPLCFSTRYNMSHMAERKDSKPVQRPTLIAVWSLVPSGAKTDAGTWVTGSQAAHTNLHAPRSIVTHRTRCQESFVIIYSSVLYVCVWDILVYENNVRVLHSVPINPGGQSRPQTPVAGWHVTPLAHWHSCRHPAPHFPSGHSLEQSMPTYPALHSHTPLWEVKVAVIIMILCWNLIMLCGRGCSSTEL